MKRDIALLWIWIAFSIGFTLLLTVLGTTLQQQFGPFDPDQGPTDYFWQLNSPYVWAQVTAWSFYIVHQVSLWALTWMSMKRFAKAGFTWTDKPDKLHYMILLLNLAFIVLHLVQTHVWYDGLAQDVPIWSSQFSVIGMLILTLVMRAPKRGLILGKPVKVGKDAMNGMVKWHGYYIQWALVYTFWFHPMDTGLALSFGFFYMFLLLFQASTPLLKIHLGRKWVTFLEIFVWIHGTLVAIESDFIRQTGGTSWPIFFFGFFGMFALTQQFGLTSNKKITYSILASYVAIAVITFSLIGWRYAYALAAIPMVEYLVALVAWGLFALVPRIKHKVRTRQEITT